MSDVRLASGLAASVGRIGVACVPSTRAGWVMSVDVHLRMSSSQQAKLDSLAERAGTTRSGVVRRLIIRPGRRFASPTSG